jgi:TatD family-associated radical SAM protein
MASAAAAAARPGVAYTLGRTLYLSVTNRSNALSILKTRGPGFVMPPSSGFALLSDPEPDASELAAIVDATYERAEIVGMGENDPGVVFAGAGEPLLRLDVVVDTIAMVRESRHGVPFRVHSNGLHEPDVAKTLANAKVDRVTVALATADPKQFDFLTRPNAGSPGKGGDFNQLCGFIATLAEEGVDVEAVTVAAPDVDVAAARRLAESLGARAHRTREYFP